MDLNSQGISSKIALKLGYTFNEVTHYFIKANPNLDLENSIEKSI